ncbi:13593_t:CDS:2, partial [Acaulospora colombiana]
RVLARTVLEWPSLLYANVLLLTIFMTNGKCAPPRSETPLLALSCLCADVLIEPLLIMHIIDLLLPECYPSSTTPTAGSKYSVYTCIKQGESYTQIADRIDDALGAADDLARIRQSIQRALPSNTLRLTGDAEGGLAKRRMTSCTDRLLPIYCTDISLHTSTSYGLIIDTVRSTASSSGVVLGTIANGVFFLSFGAPARSLPLGLVAPAEKSQEAAAGKDQRHCARAYADPTLDIVQSVFNKRLRSHDLVPAASTDSLLPPVEIPNFQLYSPSFHYDYYSSLLSSSLC